MFIDEVHNTTMRSNLPLKIVPFCLTSKGVFFEDCELSITTMNKIKTARLKIIAFFSMKRTQPFLIFFGSSHSTCRHQKGKTNSLSSPIHLTEDTFNTEKGRLGVAEIQLEIGRLCVQFQWKAVRLNMVNKE